MEIALTIFFTEDKDEVSSAVFEIRIQMCHETDEATLHGCALLWPVGYVSQRRENLNPGLELQRIIFSKGSLVWRSLTCFLMYRRVSLWALQLSVSRLRIGVSFSFIFSP